MGNEKLNPLQKTIIKVKWSAETMKAGRKQAPTEPKTVKGEPESACNLWKWVGGAHIFRKNKVKCSENIKLTTLQLVINYAFRFYE